MHRWLSEVFEPAVAKIPGELWGKRDAAEVFHEALEPLVPLPEAGEDVGLMPAVQAYVDDVLRHAPDERAVLEPAPRRPTPTTRLSVVQHNPPPDPRSEQPDGSLCCSNTKPARRPRGRS